MRLPKLFAVLIALTTLLSSCRVLFGPRANARYPVVKRFKPIFSASDKLIGKHDSTYNVFFYDLDINIDPNRKQVSGQVTIHFVCNENKTSVKFDLDKRLTIEK